MPPIRHRRPGLRPLFKDDKAKPPCGCLRRSGKADRTSPKDRNGKLGHEFVLS